MGSKKTRKALAWTNPVTATAMLADKATGEQASGVAKDVSGVTARREAKRVAALQEQEIKRQQQLEKLSLAEAEDEKKRRLALAKYGGRRSLIATSISGMTKGDTDRLGG